MATYSAYRSKRGFMRPLGIIFFGLTLLILIVLIGARIAYSKSLGPVSSQQQTQIVTIAPGSGVKRIADQLAAAHLIKNALALQWYAHIHGASSKFQAGSYALAPSSSTPKIVQTLTQGRTATQLVTILPGRRIDQVQADLINAGFSPSAVAQALKPAQYADLPLFKQLPNNTSTLEGLLWPDSYQKDAVVGPDFIIREALQAMNEHLSAETDMALNAQGLSPYQGVILASIVEQEVSKPNDRAQAAQVFLSRLRAGTMLGSDVTALYGSLAAGQTANLSYDSLYNTLQRTGLPPTPISTISAGSLSAAAHPAATTWLYFVAGDDGTTYFSRTLAEHQALTAKYCHKLCGR